MDGREAKLKLPRSKNTVANFLPTIGKIFSQTQHWPVVRPKVEVISTKLYWQRLDTNRRRKDMRDRLNTRDPDNTKRKDPKHVRHFTLRDSLVAQAMADAKIKYDDGRSTWSVSLKKWIDQRDNMTAKERRQLEDSVIAGIIEQTIENKK
jgi:hypothetical protein